MPKKRTYEPDHIFIQPVVFFLEQSPVSDIMEHESERTPHFDMGNEEPGTINDPPPCT
jgi:hypothetical protein